MGLMSCYHAVPIKVQANVIVYLKVTMTGYWVTRCGSKVKMTVKTNGTTITFFDNNVRCLL